MIINFWKNWLPALLSFSSKSRLKIKEMLQSHFQPILSLEAFHNRTIRNRAGWFFGFFFFLLFFWIHPSDAYIKCHNLFQFNKCLLNISRGHVLIYKNINRNNRIAAPWLGHLGKSHYLSVRSFFICKEGVFDL